LQDPLSIIEEKIKNVKICSIIKVRVRVVVAYSSNKLALRTRLRNLNLKSIFSIFDSFRDIRVNTYDFLKFVGGFWAL